MRATNKSEIANKLAPVIIHNQAAIDWLNRAYHEITGLCNLLAVHHSVNYMDWLDGLRNHVLQTFSGRIIAIISLYLFGADKSALEICVAFTAFQALYVNANANLSTGWLKYIFRHATIS